MPQHPNNDLYNFPSERNKGIIGTTIIHVVVLGMLFLIGLSVPPVQQEEGILVNFGTDETGFGMIEPSLAAAAMENSEPSASADPSSVTSEDEPILTQDFEEAPEVKSVDPDAAKKREEELEAERIRRAELEAERIRREQEEAERQRVLEEQQRRTNIIDRTRNAFSNAQNVGTTSTSEGVAGGTGNQGSPTGSVTSTNRGDGSGTGNDGVRYDLGERGVQKLEMPVYNYQKDGVVVVSVQVDRNGKVIRVTPGRPGTTTYDEDLTKAATDAALKTVFDPDLDAEELFQTGTITYRFTLK